MTKRDGSLPHHGPQLERLEGRYLLSHMPGFLAPDAVGPIPILHYADHSDPTGFGSGLTRNDTVGPILIVPRPDFRSDLPRYDFAMIIAAHQPDGPASHGNGWFPADHGGENPGGHGQLPWSESQRGEFPPFLGRVMASPPVPVVIAPDPEFGTTAGAKQHEPGHVAHDTAQESDAAFPPPVGLAIAVPRPEIAPSRESVGSEVRLTINATLANPGPVEPCVTAPVAPIGATGAVHAPPSLASLGSDLLDAALADDSASLALAADRFLKGLTGLVAPADPDLLPAENPARWPAVWAAALVSLEVSRRWLREADATGPRRRTVKRWRSPGGDDALARKLNGWPGSWSARYL